MHDRDKVMEAVHNSAYSHSCECPVCGKNISRNSGEDTVYCSKCGQKLHLRAFTDAEIREALFQHEMDEYED